jgi:CubicO group peptidase (beta-lactamase class C family)
MNRKPFFPSVSVGLVLAGLFVQSVAFGASTSKPPKPTEAKEIFDLNKVKRLDEVLKAAVASEQLPSAVCYVSFLGEPIYYKAFGEAVREDKGRSLSKDAIFRIGSQTKLVTTVALMKLYEEGLINLEDPIKKYLPEFANPVVRVSGSMATKNLVTRPAKGDITIRQLLCHTSGITYDKSGQDLEEIRYGYPISSAEVVARIAKMPLKSDPGTAYAYGWSVDVAGRLAEVVSGMRLDSLIKRTVLDPLEMTDTYFYLPKTAVKRLVSVYSKTDKESAVALADSLDRNYPLDPAPSYFGGGAGLCSTAEDYAHLCQMILNGGVYKGKRFMHKKVVDMITADQLFGVGGNYQFGLGMEIGTKEMFARTMRTVGSLSAEGEYGTHFLMDPKYKLVIQLYTNETNWPSDRNVWSDVLRVIYTSTLK